MYLALSLFILADYLVCKFWDLNVFERILLVFVSLFLLSNIILLASKIFLFLTPIGLFLIFLHHQLISLRYGIIAVISAIAFYVILISSVPSTRSRITRIFDIGFEDKKRYSTLTIRFEKWQCSTQLILAHPVWGVGIGDAQDLLNKCYKENKFWGHVREFNSHNQFLQTQLQVGIIGTIFLISSFITVLAASRKMLYLPIILSILLFLIFNLFESTLQRQKGVLFFVFLSSIIFILKQKRGYGSENSDV
jgi:O-antigen ligase